MKISDQGFTERIPSQTSRTSGVSGNTGNGSSSVSDGQGSSENLQLSSLASILQQSKSLDSQRSSRVSELASAIRNNTFQFNASQISSALVSEAARPAAR